MTTTPVRNGGGGGGGGGGDGENATAAIIGVAVKHTAACIFTVAHADPDVGHVACDALYALHAYMRTLAPEAAVNGLCRFAIPPPVLAAACIVAAERYVGRTGRHAYDEAAAAAAAASGHEAAREAARLDALVRGCFSYFDRPLVRSADNAKRATLAKALDVAASRHGSRTAPWDFPRHGVLREIGKMLPGDGEARGLVTDSARVHARAAFVDAQLALDEDARRVALACICLVAAVAVHERRSRGTDDGAAARARLCVGEEAARSVRALLHTNDVADLLRVQRRIVGVYASERRIVRSIVGER